ncbi:molecular chaperone TorD family protein [Chloroflexota bacterium]
MDASSARQRSEIYTDLANAYLKAKPGLESEFTRLFLGPGRPVAHPYESVYLEKRTMGESTLDVRRRLTDEGLTPGSRILPDHVSVELSFMAHLTSREALAWGGGRDHEAKHYLELQESFMRDHLTAWLPQFCHRVLAGRPIAAYAELAQVTESFVAADTTRVREWVGDIVVVEAGVAARQQEWSLSVRRGCTLCIICVQVCQPGALRRELDERRAEAVLHWDSTLCDGCAACESWCPEEVICVVRSPEGRTHPGGALARSELLACPGCGRFHATASMVAKIESRVGQANEALLERLLLCQDCKVMDIDLRQQTITPDVIQSSLKDATRVPTSGED